MSTQANTLHLAAEAAAWPFASTAAFERRTCALVRDDGGSYVASTETLAQALVSHLRPRARGLSLEIVRQLVDARWFSVTPAGERGGRQRLPLESLLAGLAREHLQLLGPQVALHDRHEVPIEQVAESWRWLSLVLPPDLLIAASAADAGTDPVGEHVCLGAPHLEQFFRKREVAQCHLHVGAALPFEWLWTHLMSRVGRVRPDASALETGGDVPLGSAQAFRGWLVTAALARLVLASFLTTGHRMHAEDIISFATRLHPRPTVRRVVVRVLRTLWEGREPLPAEQVAQVLRRMGATVTTQWRPGSLEELRRADPLWAWAHEGGAPGESVRASAREGALPETLFATRALRALSDPRSAPELQGFGELFWQYERIRNLTYRFLVEEPGTEGLDWFTVHQQRIGALRVGLHDRALMASALALEARGPPLRSLEVRTSPWPDWRGLHRFIEYVADAPAPEGCEPERGLVLHFLKEVKPAGRPGGSHPSAPRDFSHRPHADPRHPQYGCRFGRYFFDRQCEVIAITHLLTRRPESLVILRGMDVCNLELAVPTWVFCPLLERVREVSQRVSAALAPNGALPPLRLTVHAGEDFRRLAEGLRHVHELLEYRILGAGDRVGHATALGVAPDAWAAGAPCVWQPDEERLDDLLWEVARYRAGHMDPIPRRLEQVRGEIEKLSQCIYGESKPLECLLEARDLRHDHAFLTQRLRYPFMLRTGPRGLSAAERLAWTYLTDFPTYARGRQPRRVIGTPLELEVLREAQRMLRRQLARLGIVVEANPSSNMLTGDLDLTRHPAFQLNPLPGQPAADGARVLVALGDDDPITFASNLPDELCHLYYALIRTGVAAQDALTWLSNLCDTGLTARFTLRESVAPRERRRGPRLGARWRHTGAAAG